MVFAEWVYYALAETGSDYVGANMVELYYPENVPNDEEEEISHNALLLKVISGDEGLNNPESLLSNALSSRLDDNYDDVSSNQQVSGGNLRNVFASTEGFENVGFLVYFYSETEYYIFTYDNRDTSSLGKKIEVYKTIAVYQDGEWVLKGGYEGTAITVEYDGKTNGPYKNTIAFNSWLPVENV